MYQNYQFSSVPDMVAGAGCSNQLGKTLASWQLKSVFIVSDNQLLRLGLLDDIINSLEQAAIAVTIYSDIEPDPTQQSLLKATEQCMLKRHDGIIGIGGGSPMDVAKLVAVLANEGSIKDLAQRLQTCYGVDQIGCGRKPLVQIPTTAGTGSEATMVAIITTDETTKSGVVSRTLLADKIFLDPLLTLSLPANSTAYTGIDSMVHAIEAYTSKRLKNPLSDMLAKQSLTLLAGNITTAVECGTDIEARSNMLLGAMLAGCAFANAPVGGVHALAYPLGGIYHIAHGLSNALVLPAVLRHNGTHSAIARQQYAELLGCLGIASDSYAEQALARYFEALTRQFNLPYQLRQMDIAESALAELAQAALLQQRLLVNNPLPLDYDDIYAIYQQCY